MTANILPPAISQYVDQNGKPLTDGFLYFYEVGTLVPKDTYQNAAATILNANPLPLSVIGGALIFGTGDYRVQLRDQANVLIYDQITSTPLNASAISPAFAPVAAASTLSLARDLLGVTSSIAQAIAAVSTIQGPVGPAGPVGGLGATGPTGPAGPLNPGSFGSNAQGQWLQFTSGLIQWGTGVTSSDNFTGNFPIPFPNQCTSLIASPLNGIGGGEGQCQVQINNSSTFYVKTKSRLGDSSGPFYWVGLGF